MARYKVTNNCFYSFDKAVRGETFTGEPSENGNCVILYIPPEFSNIGYGDYCAKDHLWSFTNDQVEEV